MPTTLDVSCPNCGKELKVPTEFEGRRVKCKDCGEPIAEARLKAIPWTRSCIACKEKQNKA